MDIDMIGQSNLIDKIESLTVDTFPHSLILRGEWGSGRHTLTNIIAQHLNLQIIDITESISREYIDELYLKIEPYIYLIDSKYISTKEQNSLLKFVEEPLKNSFIIFLAERTTSLLPTINNRCQVWMMNPYDTSMLSKFSEGHNEIFPYCNTPGQVKLILDTCVDKIPDMVNLCDKMVEKMKNASFSNVLSISNNISFKDDNDKFPYTTFIHVLYSRICYHTVAISCDPIMFKIFERTRILVADSDIPHVNTQHLFENYLRDLKDIISRKG